MKTSLDDEKIFSFLNDFNKVEVALTVLGLKSAFILEWWEPLSKGDLIKDESHELEQFLADYKLVTQSIFTIEGQVAFCKTFCAINKENLAKLIATEFVEGDSEAVIRKKDKERGILLGYPETAVEAYIDDDCIEDDDFPESVRKFPEFKFLQSRLSKKHWQAEFDDFKKKIAVLKNKFPDLYNRVAEGNMIDDGKDKVWEALQRQANRITDRLGTPIDENIKDVVVGLNANDIGTISSCGGHIDDDRLAFPWIGCTAPGQPEFRYKDEKKIKETIAKKYGIRPGDIFSLGNSVAEKDWYEMAKTETDEYVEWDKKNGLLEEKVIKLIEEFYSKRTDEPAVRIEHGDVYPGCLIDISDNDEKRWRETLSTDDLKSKIIEAQKEMGRFGDFLKDKFFEAKK